MRALLRRPHISRRGYVKRRVSPPSPPAGAPAAREEMDLAARRVRAAGGPTDVACYQCTCGCVFDAAVSTSVRCPH
jgi:hypothetical protein